MSSSTRYQEIDISGSPRELGRQLGEAAGDQIRGFCAIALERVNRTVAITPARALNVARESIPIVAEYAPEMIEELQGTAEAAHVALEELMLLQVRNQLKAEGGCTSFSLGPPRRNERIVAQNWDADPALDDLTIVLTRRPTGKPAFMTITQAGLIAYIGFNTAGIGLCANTLPAPSRRLGVPHYFLLRAIYEASSLKAAVAAVNRAQRAIPANIMMTTPEGPANLEVTLDSVCVLEGEGTGLVTHTNHCRHPDLISINHSFPELIQSYARQARIDLLLNPSLSGHSTPLQAEAAIGANPAGMAAMSPLHEWQAALSDHDGYPRSICRHVNEDQPNGFWQTVFSVIIEPEQRRMHITRGTPCSHPYEIYELK